MSKFYYLIPNESNDIMSILVQTDHMWNNGKEGRWKDRAGDPETKTWAGMVVPVKEQTKIEKCKFVGSAYNIKIFDEWGKIVSLCGGEKKGWEPIDYINSWLDDVDHDVRYLSFNSKGDLVLNSHKKGEFSATILQWYFENHWYDWIIGSAGESSHEYTVTHKTKDPWSVPDGDTPSGFRVTITLTFTQEVLATKGEYDIGSAYAGSNMGNTFCFYCNDNNKSNPLSYLTTVPYTTIDKHNSRVHSCTKHNAKPATTTPTVDNTVGTDTWYNGSGTYTTNATPDRSSLGNVDILDYGTTGDYVDGVASVPMVMIELGASQDAKASFNLSVPSNSFVSLTHERNMADSYNTFTLQLFDKDAMQVEAKLLLGFRYITFYYTDFISTSKRFKGMILDYKTVIAGKGLMLTITGYSSNVNTYIGKDSIPWSYMCSANAPSFYYWMNDAGEYHGEVRINDSGQYCSSEGSVVSPNTTQLSDIGEYHLKCPETSTDENGNQTVTNVWVSYSEYYRDKVDDDVLKEFKPKPKLFELSTQGYNPQLDNVLADEIFRSDDGKFELSKKRPSDIVKLICIMNKWSYEIVPTKSVNEIPDQISMSYVEYIKEKLIPISVSEGTVSSTQYYFWFDDDGVAHYAPYQNSGQSVKKVYFNSVDHKDSYKLIGFTSANSGAASMVTDATNVMETINAFTGDEMSLSAISDTTTDPNYMQTVRETAEWYSTNKIIQANNKEVSLITYPNTSTLPSETELKNQLMYRYGTISTYSYKANLDVYGCADLTPGNEIEIYIYLDDGKRSSDPVSRVDDEYAENQRLQDEVWYDEEGNKYGHLVYLDESKHYVGNLTMHHSSGRYIINKITDTISAGKYLTSLEVLKISKNKLLDTITYDSSTDSTTEEKEDISNGSKTSEDE